MKSLEEYMEFPYRLELVEDKEEGGFVASFPELPGCATCAATMDEAYSMAEDAKREWFKAAIEDNYEIPEPMALRNYSGQFKFRIPKSLHRSLTEHARREGVSMNAYCVYLLTKYDAVENMQYMK